MKKCNTSLKLLVSALFIFLISVPVSDALAQKKESRSVDSFESITLSIHANVYVRQGNKTSVHLEGPARLLKEVETIVEGSTLKIRFKDRWFRRKGSNEKFKVYLSSPKIKNLKISGSGNILGQTPIKTDYASYTISGSGNIQIDDLQAREIECTISGSGDIRLKGDELSLLDLRITGSGDIDTRELKARNVSISIAGSGNCKVYASDELKARVAGSGDIYYYGNPQVNAKSAGSGKIKSMNHDWD